jgi:hypothetical protein
MTPVLFGLFSWISRAGHMLQKERPTTPHSTAWYAKSLPTFAGTIALVRRDLWRASETFPCPAANLKS